MLSKDGEKKGKVVRWIGMKEYNELISVINIAYYYCTCNDVIFL